MTEHPITSEPMTEAQKKQVKRFAEDACDRVFSKGDIDKKGLQQLIERGDEFQSCIITGIKELSMRNQYGDEEVGSSFGYPSGYHPKPIAEQAQILRRLWPNFCSVDEKLADGDLPPNAEGWFAIPRWEKIASTYGEAVQKVLDLIKQALNGNFCDFSGALRTKFLLQHEHTQNCFNYIGSQQGDPDIIVLPAQFGLLHRGRSVRRACQVFGDTEFSLGSFQVAVMILTHLERLQYNRHLWVHCGGDKFHHEILHGYGHIPVFYYLSCVTIEMGWIDSCYDTSGPASGFISESRAI